MRGKKSANRVAEVRHGAERLALDSRVVLGEDSSLGGRVLEGRGRDRGRSNRGNRLSARLCVETKHGDFVLAKKKIKGRGLRQAVLSRKCEARPETLVAGCEGFSERPWTEKKREGQSDDEKELK